MPGPANAPAKIVPNTTPFDPNAAESARLDWLNHQPLPTDDTVSLGECYRHGVLLTNYFYIAYTVIEEIRVVVDKRYRTQKVWQLCDAFVRAFGVGVNKFSNDIADDCDYVLKNGKYREDAVVLSPKHLPKSDGIKLSVGPQRIAKSFIAVMELLCFHFPALKQVRKGMATSYASLLTSALETGKAFFAEYFHWDLGGDGSGGKVGFPDFDAPVEQPIDFEIPSIPALTEPKRVLAITED